MADFIGNKSFFLGFEFLQCSFNVLLVKSSRKRSSITISSILICHSFPSDSGRVLSLVKQKPDNRIFQRTWQIHPSLLWDFQEQGRKCWPETSEVSATSRTRGKFLRYKIHNPIVCAELLINYSLPQKWCVFDMIFQSTDITAKRTAVLRGLPLILGDDNMDFFKICFVSQLCTVIFFLKSHTTGCLLYLVLLCYFDTFSFSYCSSTLSAWISAALLLTWCTDDQIRTLFVVSVVFQKDSAAVLSRHPMWNPNVLKNKKSTMNFT